MLASFGGSQRRQVSAAVERGARRFPPCVILSGAVYAAQSNAERAVRRDLGLDVSTPLCLEENYHSPSVREGTVLVRILCAFSRVHAKRGVLWQDKTWYFAKIQDPALTGTPAGFDFGRYLPPLRMTRGKIATSSRRMTAGRGCIFTIKFDFRTGSSRRRF